MQYSNSRNKVDTQNHHLLRSSSGWEKTRVFLIKPSPVGFIVYFGFYCFFLIKFYFFSLQVLCQTPQDKTQTWDILHTHKLPRLFIVSKFICFQNSNAAGLRQKKGWCEVKAAENDQKKLEVVRMHCNGLI